MYFIYRERIVQKHHFILRIRGILTLRYSQLAFQLHQLVPLGTGNFFPPHNQRIDCPGRETSGRVRVHVRFDIHVYHFLVFLVLLDSQKRGHLVDNSRHGLQTGSVFQFRLHVHPDDNISTHFFRYIHREIIRYSPVYQHHPVPSHRGEHPRDSHTRAHGKRQSPAILHHLLAVHQITCHASERDRQPVEIKRIVIPYRQIGKQIEYILSADKPRRDLQLAIVLNRHGNKIFLRFLFLRERQVITIHFITQQKHPVLRPHQTIHRARVITDRVQSPHESPHTRARDIIYRDTRLFQHLQHTDMRHSFRPAAT